jgi:anti-anti-sigma factor
MPDNAEEVVTVTEAFDGVAVDRIGRRIATAMLSRPRRLVVDLRDCPLVDAGALAILLQAHRAMLEAGGTLTLRSPAERVRRILRIARLDNVFAVEDAVGIRDFPASSAVCA